MRFLYIISVLIIIDSWSINAKGQNFHYPSIPDTIYNRQERVVYMLSHFWEKGLSNDTILFNKPDVLLDYVYLLKQIHPEEQSIYIKHFIEKACKQEITFRSILWWLDNILYNSCSPYYDECMYNKFLHYILICHRDEDIISFSKDRLETLKINRVGCSANDFSYVDKLGNNCRLYHIKSPLLLLIFNSPDCSLCSRTEILIKDCSLIKKLMRTNLLSVLAITPGIEYDAWMQHSYPKDWMVGFDKDSMIYNLHLYDIQRFPSIYLLDSEKRVLLKEADFERLYQYLLKFLI